MTHSIKRTGAAVLSLILLCMLTLNAMAASNLTVGVKFWKERSDKESMANNGIDSDRDASIIRQSNGTYTLTLPIKQVSKMGVTGYLSGLTIGDVTYSGTVSGDISKGTAVLTIKKKYGKNAILKGMDLEKGATARDRNGQIGGHKA